MWRLDSAESGTGSEFSHASHRCTEQEKCHISQFKAYKLDLDVIFILDLLSHLLCPVKVEHVAICHIKLHGSGDKGAQISVPSVCLLGFMVSMSGSALMHGVNRSQDWDSTWPGSTKRLYDIIA